MNDGINLKLVGTIIGVAVIILLGLAALPFAMVGAGERGVIFNNATGVENRILGEGFHFRVPFLQSVHTVSIKVQKNDIKAEAASSDLQTVNTDIVVNWHLDAGKVNKVYQEIGDLQTVVDRILTPAVSEVVKASVAKYTAEEVIAKRPLLKQDVDKLLGERLTAYFIILDDVSIVNIDFSKDFNVAIEAKTVSAQSALKAENDLRRIKVEAEQKIAQATAEAKAMEIKTQALEKSAKLVDYEAVLRWDGKLPTYMLSGVVPFLNIPNLGK